jgi:predicted RNA binding protein YcfA (HicA-like mRNA interferase family)
VTYREVDRKLRRLGCEEVPRRSGTGHRNWRHSTTRASTVVSDWGNKDLKTGTVRALVCQLGIDWDAFRKA